MRTNRCMIALPEPATRESRFIVGRAEDIVAWTVRVGLDEVDQAELMAGYCERLFEAGVPIWRASIGADTLHPLIVAQGHRWLPGEGVHEEFFPRASTPEGEEQWLRSPWRWMIEGGEQQMRRRLAVGEGTNEFPLLADLAAQGGTDYWAGSSRSVTGQHPRRARSGHVLDDPRPRRLRRARSRPDRRDAAGLRPRLQGKHGG